MPHAHACICLTGCLICLFLQILRIENPDTHEELNLDAIKKEVAKKEKAAEAVAPAKEAPSPAKEAPAPVKEAPAPVKEVEPKDKPTESKPEAEIKETRDLAPAAEEESLEVVAPKPKVSFLWVKGTYRSILSRRANLDTLV